MTRRLRILTWHVHGNYLYNLSQVPHDFYLLKDAAGSPQRVGRCGILPWGDNVHDAPVEALHALRLDAVLYQSRQAWDEDRLRWLSAAQQALPRIVLEHDPPQQHPTDTVHWADDPDTLLVHVTPFNALMWDPGRCPVRVVEHGVKPLDATVWQGGLERGLVVVNHLARRGRRLGADLYLDLQQRLPLSLAGMGSESLPGGLGEIGQLQLPRLMAAHRFFFHPIRYTSLGLALVEALLMGMPVVGFATTELSTVIRSGENGFIDTRPERLAEAMQALLDEPGLAARWGRAGQQMARERFGIGRFVADWMRVFDEVCA
ncbi:MAG TPA: glycosyltransferase family 4 protein [Burkholderiaceae bacterium]|nr:glycosyltransferase family 4 protein [Burkholderiaceae bacterium]